MKPRRINDTYDLIVTDAVAEWDAPSSWERDRIADTIDRLGPNDTLMDIGAEHGWISGLYAKYIGCQMILVEPSPEFWPNIRLVWEHNDLPEPALCVRAFMGAEPPATKYWWHQGWPTEAKGAETGAMAYRSIASGHAESQFIPVLRVDDFPIIPSALTIDVEGAELLVLQGAKRTLERDRPTVWCSVHPDLMERDYNSTPNQLMEYMAGCGYRKHFIATDHEMHYRFDPQ